MGWGMTQNVQARLNFFELEADVHRVALNPEQAPRYKPNLPRKVLKKGDKVGRKWVKEFGEDFYELDAIPPLELQQILRRTIEAVLDMDLLAELKAEEEELRGQI